MPIAQNTALFSLVGTTYGGDGRTTLALPDLQGRAPMHPGDRRPDEIRVIDITLLPEERGMGIGGALMRSVLDEGAAATKPVRIHVERNNRAVRLYERLGFLAKDDESEGIYRLMEWSPPRRTGVPATWTPRRVAGPGFPERRSGDPPPRGRSSTSGPSRGVRARRTSGVAQGDFAISFRRAWASASSGSS